MSKAKKVATEKVVAVTEKKKDETAESYVATAEKHGCPVLDIVALLVEGFQAWRHGRATKVIAHKEN